MLFTWDNMVENVFQRDVQNSVLLDNPDLIELLLSGESRFLCS